MLMLSTGQQGSHEVVARQSSFEQQGFRVGVPSHIAPNLRFD